ncbi:MAG: hypothetical protein QOF71_2173 [Candidatus Eremiobacteraeota bacterium]|nr:hypothetical protein [Candidatus Eremiobacteraeota bacterium]
MKYLVNCDCGHGLDRHTAGGCSGDGRFSCPCVNDQERALDSAVDQARRSQWGAPRVDETAEIA